MLLFLLVGNGVQATHYAGGQITYTWVTGTTYLVKETVYRDCAGISLGSTSLLNISPAASGITSRSLQRVSITDITPLCPGQVSRCASTSGAYGYQEHIYQLNISFPALPGGATYRLSSTLNARNNAITTISNAGSTNLYLETFLNPNFSSPGNSSPAFLNIPVAFLCVNQPATISPNAFDPNGDAIQYSLTACRTTATQNLPYAPGFSPTSPLTTSGGVSIDASTGLLSFTPTAVQVGVVCIKAEEFRNGNKIGQIIRDIQVRVLNCNNAAPVIANITNYFIQVGQQLCVNVSATDSDLDNITLTAVGGIIPPATFVQLTSNPGSATGQFCFTPTLANAGQTYTITINAQDDGCPASASGSETFNITIPVPCNMAVEASGTNPTCGSANGSASVSIINGTPPFNYTWSGPGNFQSSAAAPSGLVAGTYCVVVQDGNSCVDSTCVTITGSASAVTVSASVVDASCGQSNGSITVTASGGAAPYTYSLNGGTPQGSNVFSGLGQGSYAINVSDINGCTAQASATVGQAADVTPPVIVCPANISVNNDPGQCGAVVSFAATATDDCGPATVVQSSGSASGSLFPVGTSSVSFTATDGSGNVSSCSFTVTVADNEAPSVSCPADASLSCIGDLPQADPASVSASDNCSGVVVSHVSDSQNNGSGCAGSPLVITRTYVATDASQNTATCTQTFTIEDNHAPVITCPANITVSNDPGHCSAAVGFSASASDGCSSTTISYSSAPNSTFSVGTTSVTATASDACNNTSSCTFTVTVNDNEAPNAVCHGFTVQLDANGAASITASDVDGGSTDNCGIASISASPTSFGCSNVGGNAVTLTVTDVNGNSSSCTANVEVEDNIAPSAVCQNITLNLGSTGSVTIGASDVDGGSSDNCGVGSLSIDHGTFSCDDLGSNTVTLTVTDVNGNSSTCTASVTVNNDPLSISVSSATFACGYNVSCNGASDGSVSSSTSGGCAPYSYSWSNGGSADNIGNVAAGTYSVTVTDVNGATATASITLTEPDPLSTSLSSPTYNGGWNVSCNGASDGSVSSSTAGGCAPYSYNWSNGSTSANPGNLAAGAYSVTVTDANGCTATASITLSEPPALTADAGSNVTVYYPYQNSNCTTLSGSQSGGTTPYTVSWSDGSSTISSTSSVQVCPTTSTVYYYTVVDANGCTATDSVQVCVTNVVCTDRTNNGVGGSGQSGNGGGQVHISICHIPPGNPANAMTKCIPAGAVASHLAHGDYLGACGSNASACEFPTNGGGSKVAQGSGAETQAVHYDLGAYPNPTNGTLSVSLDCHECGTSAVFSVELVDMMGQVIDVQSMDFHGEASTVEFDLSGMASGFYMVMVNAGDIRITRKVMKN